MGSIRSVEEAIRSKFNVAAGPALHDRVLAQVRRAKEQAETTLAFRKPSLGRTIMANPLTKLSAAAVVIAAVTIIILDRSVTPAYALADLLTTFDQARVIHVKGRHYYYSSQKPGAAEAPPVEVQTDNWIDLGNDRLRYTQTGVSDNGKGNVTVRKMETVCDGACTMLIDHAGQRVIYMRISDLNRELTTYRLSRLVWTELWGQPNQLKLAEFVKVGQENIDGTPYDIWQRDMAPAAQAGGGAPGVSLRFKLWLTADRGRLGRSQMWMQKQDGQWQLQNDFQTVEYDIQPPADTFALVPPPGYTAANARETAPLMPMTAGSGSSNGAAELASFTLVDGSVVMGWHSSDRRTKESQEPLFAPLVFGGPLPKLPVELFGLKPAGAANGTTYTGYHLAWTRQANRFIEWGLYVPDAEPPAGVRSLGYDVLCRYNLDPQPRGTFGLTAEYGLPVENAADFQKYVLGAMGEFSDNGTPPADVTWQKVVDLARQIRNH